MHPQDMVNLGQSSERHTDQDSQQGMACVFIMSCVALSIVVCIQRIYILVVIQSTCFSAGQGFTA